MRVYHRPYCIGLAILIFSCGLALAQETIKKEAAPQPKVSEVHPAQKEAPTPPQAMPPEPSKQEVPTPPQSIPPVVPSAQPPEPAKQEAPPPPKPAKKEMETCAKHIQGMAALYEEKAREIEKFSEKAQERLKTFQEMENDLKNPIQAATQEMEAKMTEDPKKNKKALQSLQKEISRLNKELKTAQKENLRQCAVVAQQLDEMGKRHIEEIREKFKEIKAVTANPTRE